MLPPAARRETYSSRNYDEEDVEMGGSETPSPALAPIPNSHQPSVSPALLPQDASDRHNQYYKDRQNSYSSVSTNRHYSFSNSTTTSPALLPSVYDYNRSSAAGSALTSPALLPQRDIDQEATAALLMLNTDRRSTQGRGMSVKDLLSTWWGWIMLWFFHVRRSGDLCWGGWYGRSLVSAALQSWSDKYSHFMACMIQFTCRVIHGIFVLPGVVCCNFYLEQRELEGIYLIH